MDNFPGRNSSSSISSQKAHFLKKKLEYLCSEKVFLSLHASRAAHPLSHQNVKICAKSTNDDGLAHVLTLFKTDKSKRRIVCFSGKVLTDEKSPPLFLDQFSF
jgi:hypothetical protein